MWIILRDRVGGDGSVKGSSSDIGLTFLVLAEAGRLTDLVSVGAREPVALEFCEPFSAADCKAGGGRVRLDSEADDELHGLSCAAISVEAAGVRGRVGVGMSLEILLPFEGGDQVSCYCTGGQCKEKRGVKERGILRKDSMKQNWRARDPVIPSIEHVNDVQQVPPAIRMPPTGVACPP